MGAPQRGRNFVESVNVTPHISFAKIQRFISYSPQIHALFGGAMKTAERPSGQEP